VRAIVNVQDKADEVHVQDKADEVHVQDKADVANNVQGQAADNVENQALPHIQGNGNLILDVRRELVLLHPGIHRPRLLNSLLYSDLIW